MKKSPYMGPANLYSLILPDLRTAAHNCGYAIGLHGTMTNDLDLIAVPWTNEAVCAEKLVDDLRDSVNGFLLMDNPQFPPRWEDKPHGRRAVSIYLIGSGEWGGLGEIYIDLSIMPRKIGV